MNPLLAKASWYEKGLSDGTIRPYVYVRDDNKIANPGSLHRLDWFPIEPLYIDPLEIENLGFAEAIYYIENQAFGPSNMPMPRWVFYDCAIIPGFVGGFAMKSSALTGNLKKIYESNPKAQPTEWVPLSLFIIIPTMAQGQWVAHNLCAVNSLLPEAERFYGLGFLSKAFSLWYANVEICVGVTQWGSPSLKLHSHYGPMQVMTAYTPVHSHAKTMTYEVMVNTKSWESFFTRQKDQDFVLNFERTPFAIDPTSEASMKDLNARIQNDEGPYFLSADEISIKKLTDPLTLFVRRN